MGRYIFCGTFRRARFDRTPPAVSRHAALWRPDFPPLKQGRLPIRQVTIHYRICSWRERDHPGVREEWPILALFRIFRKWLHTMGHKFVFMLVFRVTVRIG
jgi:hypothetical protein